MAFSENLYFIHIRTKLHRFFTEKKEKYERSLKSPALHAYNVLTFDIKRTLNIISSSKLNYVPRCSYLDIYISRKIRLCVADLKGKFQTNLQAKLLNFLVWKFRSIILIFLLFFAEFVKSTASYKLLRLFQRVDMFELQFDAKITIQACQLFGIAATVCKKQWI